MLGGCPSVISVCGGGGDCPSCNPSVVSQDLGSDTVLRPTQTAGTTDLRPKAVLPDLPSDFLPLLAEPGI